ncbi:unnamed protein product, partial [Phaeothamnion confervicola]
MKIVVIFRISLPKCSCCPRRISTNVLLRKCSRAGACCVIKAFFRNAIILSIYEICLTLPPLFPSPISLTLRVLSPLSDRWKPRHPRRRPGRHRRYREALRQSRCRRHRLYQECRCRRRRRRRLSRRRSRLRGHCPLAHRRRHRRRCRRGWRLRRFRSRCRRPRERCRPQFRSRLMLRRSPPPSSRHLLCPPSRCSRRRCLPPQQLSRRQCLPPRQLSCHRCLPPQHLSRRRCR